MNNEFNSNREALKEGLWSVIELAQEKLGTCEITRDFNRTHFDGYIAWLEHECLNFASAVQRSLENITAAAKPWKKSQRQRGPKPLHTGFCLHMDRHGGLVLLLNTDTTTPGKPSAAMLDGQIAREVRRDHLRCGNWTSYFSPTVGGVGILGCADSGLVGDSTYETWKHIIYRTNKGYADLSPEFKVYANYRNRLAEERLFTKDSALTYVMETDAMAAISKSPKQYGNAGALYVPRAVNTYLSSFQKALEQAARFLAGAAKATDIKGIAEHPAGGVFVRPSDKVYLGYSKQGKEHEAVLTLLQYKSFQFRQQLRGLEAAIRPSYLALLLVASEIPKHIEQALKGATHEQPSY